MKCDSCKFKKVHIGAGAPDDYSTEYCSKGHWEGGLIGEVIEEDAWASCSDFYPKEPELVEEKDGPTCFSCGGSMSLAPSEIIYECECGYWYYSSS